MTEAEVLGIIRSITGISQATGTQEATQHNPRRDGSYIIPLMILTNAHHSTMKRHSGGDKHGKRQ